MVCRSRIGSHLLRKQSAMQNLLFVSNGQEDQRCKGRFFITENTVCQSVQPGAPASSDSTTTRVVLPTKPFLIEISHATSFETQSPRTYYLSFATDEEAKRAMGVINMRARVIAGKCTLIFIETLTQDKNADAIDEDTGDLSEASKTRPPAPLPVEVGPCRDSLASASYENPVGRFQMAELSRMAGLWRRALVKSFS
jgi:hypothetical protein